MKLFFTLILLLVSIAFRLNAQDIDTCFFKPITTHRNIADPLVVIDGIPYEFNEIKKLHPDEIASIDILKSTSEIFLCSISRPIIVVTTKSASVRKFIIKDFLTGEKIPAATICFTAKNDTIKAAADDNGILRIDKLKTGVQYSATISSAGYKTISIAVSGKRQEVLMERDIKEECGIVVICTDCIRKISCGFSVRITRERQQNKIISGSFMRPIYPNPVQRNNAVHLEFKNDHDESMQLNVLNLNSSLILSQQEKVIKGCNHLSFTADAKWSAGIYVIQLRDQKGNVVKQEKLIVQ